jgi:HD-GYP domain-containing protein (c-di-GMP phosphodiesterase class II)
MANFRETKIKSSILVTVTLLFFLIGVLPLFVSNWKLISISRKELESNLRENFLAVASSVSSQIASYLNLYRIQARDFSPKAINELQNLEAGGVDTELPSLMKDPNIIRARIINKEGKGRYAQRIDLQDPNVAGMETEAIHLALQGNSYVGKPYFSRVDDIPFLLIAEPLRSQNGQQVGAVSIMINLEPILRILAEQSSGGEHGIVVYVVDSKGNLLLHPKKSVMESHPNLSESAFVNNFIHMGGVTTVRTLAEKQNGKDVDVIGTFATVPDYNWGVIIQIEKDVAFAPVMKMIRESMTWGTLFALVAALLGFQFARWITNPIQVLAQHALNIGRNQNFDQKIQIKASNEIQQLADTFNYMTDEIKQKILSLEAAAKENKELFFSSIRMLAAAIDAKDPYTRGHSERVKDYSMVIGREIGLNDAELERLEIVALLHDVGKIGIEDRILRKPTNLTPEEFEIMKAHPDKGANIMSQVAQLSDVIPGMRAHHENYDGSGYPQGLKGEDIPFFARLITVADTFDAMTTDRPYQKAFTLEFAVNRIRQMAGIKYDPKIVEAFATACQESRLALAKPSRPRPKQAVS